MKIEIRHGNDCSHRSELMVYKNPFICLEHLSTKDETFALWKNDLNLRVIIHWQEVKSKRFNLGFFWWVNWGMIMNQFGGIIHID